MSPDGRLVQVEIFGQTYRLRADEDSGYIEGLASYVDGRMREVARQTSAVDSLKVAVLAALNIADDHHRLERRIEAGRGLPPESAADRPDETEPLDTRIQEWNQILDEALGA